MWVISLALLLQSPIKGDVEVIFFPTYGYLDEEGAIWDIAIHGSIFEPEVESPIRRVLLDQLRRSLGLNEQGVEAATFEQRARAFLVDNERGETISIRLGGKTIRLGESGPNGHFEGSLRLPIENAKKLISRDGWITFQAVTREDDDREFSGRVRLIGQTGLSVISDIDDTIKVSEVWDRKALLANTFLREFRAVPGMADVYRRWANQGAAFHYVSASPWQLYGPLAEFLRANDFPAGTFHLKDFRWKDSSFFNLFESPERTKREAIEPILEDFPDRRFILIGDSGEKDPEIFGELARKHPEQIIRILIRDVTGEGADADRYARSFEGLTRDRWKVFRDAGEIEAD